MGASGARSGGGGSGVPDTIRPPKKKLDLTPISIRVIKAVGKGLADAARPYNTRRRKEFISKYNTSVPPGERIDMTDEQIGSSKGLASLREVGYKTNQDMNNQNGGNGGSNNNQVTQTTQVSKTILAPTTAEVSQATATSMDGYDSRKTKAKGRSMTIMTGPGGVEDQTVTLGRKSLLGQ